MMKNILFYYYNVTVDYYNKVLIFYLVSIFIFQRYATDETRRTYISVRCCSILSVRAFSIEVYSNAQAS